MPTAASCAASAAARSTVRPGAARHFTIKGTLTRRLRRAVVLETLDSTGRLVRQAVKRR